MKFIGCFLLSLLLCCTGSEKPAQTPIVLGSINSYSKAAVHALPYRNGVDMAVAEINQAGGVLGKPLSVLHVDDTGTPSGGVLAAEQLILRDNVAGLLGVYQSRIALAVSDIAKRHEVPLIAMGGTVKLLWDAYHPYVFRTFPNHYSQTAILAEIAATQSVTRWATIAPLNEYGHSMADSFKHSLRQRRDDIAWVADQWPAENKLDAGSEIQALLASDAEAIFCPLFGADLLEFIRAGHTLGLFKNRLVFATHVGFPEFLDSISAQDAEAINGWFVNGYPWQTINTPEHQTFVKNYQQQFNARPAYTSIMGYLATYSYKHAIEQAQSTNSADIAHALTNINVASPLGDIRYRDIDHQATSSLWTGRIQYSQNDERPHMIDVSYIENTKLHPSNEWILNKRRPNKDFIEIQGLLTHHSLNVKSSEAWHGHEFKIDGQPILPSEKVSSDYIKQFIGKRVRVSGVYFDGNLIDESLDPGWLPRPISFSEEPQMRGYGLKAHTIQALY